MRHESHNLHGIGDRQHEVYDMPVIDPRDYWSSVTGVPCPVASCAQTVVWYEAGYVPGYRVCMARVDGRDDAYDMDTLRHRFIADRHAAPAPSLIRDDCCELEAEG